MALGEKGKRLGPTSFLWLGPSWAVHCSGLFLVHFSSNNPFFIWLSHCPNNDFSWQNNGRAWRNFGCLQTRRVQAEGVTWMVNIVLVVLSWNDSLTYSSGWPVHLDGGRLWEGCLGLPEQLAPEKSCPGGHWWGDQLSILFSFCSCPFRLDWGPPEVHREVQWSITKNF